MKNETVDLIEGLIKHDKMRPICFPVLILGLALALTTEFYMIFAHEKRDGVIIYIIALKCQKRIC